MASGSVGFQRHVTHTTGSRERTNVALLAASGEVPFSSPGPCFCSAGGSRVAPDAERRPTVTVPSGVGPTRRDWKPPPSNASHAAVGGSGMRRIGRPGWSTSCGARRSGGRGRAGAGLCRERTAGFNVRRFYQIAQRAGRSRGVAFCHEHDAGYGRCGTVPAQGRARGRTQDGEDLDVVTQYWKPGTGVP